MTTNKPTPEFSRQAELVKAIDPDIKITFTSVVYGGEVLVQGRYASNGRGIKNYWVRRKGERLEVYGFVEEDGKLKEKVYLIQ